MELQKTIAIDDVEFIASKFRVVVSPPDPATPKRFYANINPVNQDELAPVCFSINGCWTNSDFVDEIVARGSSNHQSVTGFWFYDPDEFEEDPPMIRFGLEPGERGVITHYMEETAEVSFAFFAKLTVAFGLFCLENGIESHHKKSDMDRILKAFKIEK